MAKGNKTPGALLRRKEDKLDWGLFGFLENLLVFCTMPTRSVPKESGVHFQISSKVKDEGICLLFKVDRQRDPLIPATAIKPDYLVAHVTGERCLLTIVEMKGRDQKKAEHGIDQIMALHDRLKSEFVAHLPGALRKRITCQGLLLTPFNAHVPGQKIEKARKAGLVIVPVQYHHKAELYPYVSVADPRSLLRSKPASRRRADWNGIYINYASLDDDEDYAALSIWRDVSSFGDRVVVAFPSRSGALKARVQAELKRLGLMTGPVYLWTMPDPSH